MVVKMVFMCVIWFNFILGPNFIFICFCVRTSFFINVSERSWKSTELCTCLIMKYGEEKKSKRSVCKWDMGDGDGFGMFCRWHQIKAHRHQKIKGDEREEWRNTLEKKALRWSLHPGPLHIVAAVQVWPRTEQNWGSSFLTLFSTTGKGTKLNVWQRLSHEGKK